METIRISIAPAGDGKLTISSDKKIIGSQYDNKAQMLVFDVHSTLEDLAVSLIFKTSKNEKFAPLSIGTHREFVLTNLYTKGHRLWLQVIVSGDDVQALSNVLEFELRESITSLDPPNIVLPELPDDGDGSGGGGIGEVISVNGKKGVVVLSKADIGLGNVDNTADPNKPVSGATFAELVILQQSLKQETADRVASDLVFETALAQEVTDRKAGDSALALSIENGLSTATTQLGNSILEAKAAVESALSSNVTTLTADIDTERTERIAAVSTEQAARIAGDENLSKLIAAITGQVTYLEAYNFGDPDGYATPADYQDALTHYAMSQVANWADSSNSTSIVNLFNGHEWLFSKETGLWSDLGNSAVATATNTSLGVVMGSTDVGYVQVDLQGKMKPNGVALTSEVTDQISTIRGELATKIENVTSDMGEMKTELLGAITSQETASGESLTTATTDLEAKILSEAVIRAAGDEALSDRIDNLTVQTGDVTQIVGGWIPDYSTIDQHTNLISANDGIWTADRDGFVQYDLMASAATALMCTIGGATVGTMTGGTQITGIAPVKIGNIVRFHVSTNFSRCSCYFIKPRAADTNIQGDPGPGVPSGGEAGQVLAKISDTDFDTQWVNAPTGGGGSGTGGSMTVIGGWLPDYNNMENINRISANGGTWTVDRDGFVRIYIFATTSAANGHVHSYVYINDVLIDETIGQTASTAGDMYPAHFIVPIKKDDIIKITYTVNNATFKSMGCYYIPPRLADVNAKGDKGEVGLGAYEMAVAKGFPGTEAQWLQSLHTHINDYVAQSSPLVVVTKNLGELFYHTGKTPPIGAIWANGQMLDLTTYGDLYQFAMDNDRLKTETEWQAIAAVQETVPYYSIADSGQFRAPRYKSFVRGTDNSAKLATFANDTMRPITGSLGAAWLKGSAAPTADSALYDTAASSDHPTAASSSGRKGLFLDSSRMGAAFSGTETAPKTIYEMPCIQALKPLDPAEFNNVQVIPDYANMETVNRITANNGTWTADRSGFVMLGGIGPSKGSSCVAFINDKRIARGYPSSSDLGAFNLVLSVAKGDLIKIISGTESTTPPAPCCYYIPPKFVKFTPAPVIAEQAPSFAVGVEFDTGMTAPDGKKIYRKTYAISASVSANAEKYVGLETGFSSTKQFIGVDSRCTYGAVTGGQILGQGGTNRTAARTFSVSIDMNGLLQVGLAWEANTTFTGYATVMYTYK